MSSIHDGDTELSAAQRLTRRLRILPRPLQRHDFRAAVHERALCTAANSPSPPPPSVRLDIDKPIYGMVLCPNQEQNDQPFTMQEEPLNRVTGVTVCSVEMAAMNNFLYVVFRRH